MVYQETSLVPSLTVAQNLYLTDAKRFHRLRGIYIAGQQFLQSLNFHVDPTAMVASLGAGQQQMVEIARAVHHNAQVIIFDEPTVDADAGGEAPVLRARSAAASSAASRSSSSAMRWRRRLPISDRITILRDGEHVVTDVTSQRSTARRSSAPWSAARCPTSSTARTRTGNGAAAPARRC